MRKVIPLVATGFIGLMIFGTIAVGVVMLVKGVSRIINKDQPPSASGGENRSPGFGLLEARRPFKTQLVSKEMPKSKRNPETPSEVNVVHYKSGDLELVAYLSKNRGEGKPRPAVVFVHDGFEGIDRRTWEQAKTFYDAGFVVMCPAFRHENRNGGRFEMFYGELDDLLAAIQYMAELPGIDRRRLYVVGVRAGGTLTLLAAAAGAAAKESERKPPVSTSVRAYFAVGGQPDFENDLLDKNARENDWSILPFDPDRKEEWRLRSAMPFLSAVRRPTYYLDIKGQASDIPENKALEMDSQARLLKVPFHANVCVESKQKSVDFQAPLLKLIAKKIADDAGPEAGIHFDCREIVSVFEKQ